VPQDAYGAVIHQEFFSHREPQQRCGRTGLVDEQICRGGIVAQDGDAEEGEVLFGCHDGGIGRWKHRDF
jgi:hypothetical protein